MFINLNRVSQSEKSVFNILILEVIKSIQVCNELERRKQGESKKPIDDNSATHVIRNALGGVSGGTVLQYERLKESLQLPPGMARHYRDDITVIVVHFNEEYLSSSTDSDDICGF